ncbi:MAG TPA: hypothetical protein PLA90_06840, partial [Candidatus Sumerlaeota bacterium]|nr:hypothetical protein [Candidatus Sumerlaeota bacterium]
PPDFSCRRTDFFDGWDSVPKAVATIHELAFVSSVDCNVAPPPLHQNAISSETRLRLPERLK